jgi:hypothetical protein
VVLIDDASSIEAELAANPYLELVVTHDEWEAVDLVESDDVALVLCRVGMRTRGGTPLYRLLWNARPAIKRRFAFIASSEPTGTGESVPTMVIRCPITAQAIVRLLDGIDAGEGSGGASVLVSIWDGAVAASRRAMPIEIGENERIVQPGRRRRSSS